MASSGNPTLGNEILRPLLVLTFVSFTCIGCMSGKFHTYRIHTIDDRAIIVPPNVKHLSRNTSLVELGGITPNADCQASEAGISVQQVKNGIRVKIDQEAIAHRADGWLMRWTGDMIDRSCLHPRDRMRVVNRILTSFPLALQDSHDLAFQSHIDSDYIDLTPDLFLKVVAPIFEGNEEEQQVVLESANPATGPINNGLHIELVSSDKLLGYEESVYRIEVSSIGNLRLAPQTTIMVRNGEREFSSSPVYTSVRFLPPARFIRMVFLARVVSDSDRDALLIFSSDRTSLESDYAKIIADPAACVNPSWEEKCWLIPQLMSLNVFTHIRVNGRTVEIIRGERLGNIMSRLGFSPGEHESLILYRPYRHGLARIDFNSSGDSILNLPLIGGEVLTI